MVCRVHRESTYLIHQASRSPSSRCSATFRTWTAAKRVRKRSRRPNYKRCVLKTTENPISRCLHPEFIYRASYCSKNKRVRSISSLVSCTPRPDRSPTTTCSVTVWRHVPFSPPDATRYAWNDMQLIDPFCLNKKNENTERGSKEFERFLSILGNKIRLKGWDKYRGGLDVKGKANGWNFFLYSVASAPKLCPYSTEMCWLKKRKVN